MAARKRNSARPRRSSRRKRRPRLLAVGAVLLVAALLLWGVVTLSRRGPETFRFAEPRDDGHSDGPEITEQDRQQLQELLESFDRPGR